MKTVQQQKKQKPAAPTTAASLKAMMQTPIGETKTESSAPKNREEKRAAAKVESKAKGKSLYYFQMTPGGNLLRAYFVAFITAQIGGLHVGKVFRLWPACNIRGHLDTGKIERKEGAYALTVQGRNYFTDPAQEADKELVAQFLKAVKTGQKPKAYNHALSPIK